MSNLNRIVKKRRGRNLHFKVNTSRRFDGDLKFWAEVGGTISMDSKAKGEEHPTLKPVAEFVTRFDGHAFQLEITGIKVARGCNGFLLLTAVKKFAGRSATPNEIMDVLAEKMADRFETELFNALVEREPVS